MPGISSAGVCGTQLSVGLCEYREGAGTEGLPAGLQVTAYWELGRQIAFFKVLYKKSSRIPQLLPTAAVCREFERNGDCKNNSDLPTGAIFPAIGCQTSLHLESSGDLVETPSSGCLFPASTAFRFLLFIHCRYTPINCPL